MAVSSVGSSAEPRTLALRKSLVAFVNQERKSSWLVSPINFASALKYFVGQAAANFPDAVHLAPCPHQHVNGEWQSPQTKLRPLVAPDGALIAFLQNNHQIHVAVVRRRAPRVRAEQINFLRLKLGFQPFHCCFQQAWRNYL